MTGQKPSFATLRNGSLERLDPGLIISNPWQVVVKPQPSHQKRKKKPFPIIAEQTN